MMPIQVLTRAVRRYLALTVFMLCAFVGAPAPLAAQGSPAPIWVAPDLQPAPTPVADDFTDAEFQTADQPDLGDRAGGSSRRDRELLFLFFYYLLYLFFCPFTDPPHCC